MRRLWSVGLAFALALGAGSVGVAYASERDDGGGARARSPIKHTIILYQENISFDHYFGTYGHGSNGIPAGATLTHTNGALIWGPYAPTQLSGTTQSRTCDVDHNYSDMINMANHGAMNQFLQFGNDKTVTNPSSSSATTCPSFETAATAPGKSLTALANSARISFPA